MNRKVSIIVPIYKGTQYIKKQIEQLYAASQRFQGHMEVIFSNDDPQTPLPDFADVVKLDVKAVQTDRNRGIQAARIRGLSAASGAYIHFLDQDDEIVPDFYQSQMTAIGNADAVYCRCYNGKRQSYNYDRVFETAFDRSKILSVCPVISPGQVVIRKESIPEFWREHILEHIGSDDYFLWLCMYGEGCVFAPNQDILYTHVRNGNNFSSDVLRMNMSDEEMVKLLLVSGMFSDSNCKDLSGLPEKLLIRRYALQRKDQIVLMVLSELLENYEKGKTLEGYFLQRGIRRLAIYGAAIMGERIRGLLGGSKVEVVCFFDKNAPFVKEDIPVYEWNGRTACDFDAILISLIENEDVVEADLKRTEGMKVYQIREIVRELSNE